MANAFRTTFTWSDLTNLDNILAYSYVTDPANKGKMFGVPDLATFEHMSKTGLEFHPEFSMLTKTNSDYIGLHNGRVLSINKWLPEQDNDAHYLFDNLDRAPFPFEYLTTDRHLDYDLRTYSRVIDFGKRVPGTWYQEDNQYGFFGPFYSEAIDDGYFVYCMISKDTAHWINNFVTLTDGQTVTYNKSSDTTYIIIRGDGVTVNGVSLPDGTIRKVKSNNLTISLKNNLMSFVCIRELQAA